MKYLTLDTNIWIYLLDDAWKGDNVLDYLEFWIEDDFIKILIPETILQEWERNKLKEKKIREKKLHEFFNMATDIFPSGFISDYRRPEKVSEIIEKQFSRIENILKNAKEIRITPDVKEETIRRSLEKLAPMHKDKNSVADSLIILSLFEFIKSDPVHEYYFVSKNVTDFFEVIPQKTPKPNEILDVWNKVKLDFPSQFEAFDQLIRKYFEKKHKLHSDLDLKFNNFNFETFKGIDALVGYLKSKYPRVIDLDLFRQERIDLQIKSMTFNPEIENLVNSLPDNSFIENINFLDTILKKSYPSKEDAKFAIALIDSNQKLYEYFFKNVESSSWFELLKKKGLFKPSTCPKPIYSKGGNQFPYWWPLSYLKKLPIQVEQDENLSKELIKIIEDFSKNPEGKNIIWGSFISIIIDIPNNKIPVKIFRYLPIWLSPKFRFFKNEHEVWSELLPKFLNENSTNEDIEKGELILKQLFSLEKIEENNKNNPEILIGLKRYKPIIEHDFFFMIKSLIEDNLIFHVAKYLSQSFTLCLSDALKKLLFYFPEESSIELETKNTKLNVQIKVLAQTLQFEITSLQNLPNSNFRFSIEGFEILTKEEIKDKFIQKLKDRGILLIENDGNYAGIYKLINYIFNGSIDYSFTPAISELGDKYIHSETPDRVYAFIFRELIAAIIKQKPEEGIELLQTLAFDKNYQCTFFKRIVLFFIGKNWEKTKHIFWKMVGKEDYKGFFSYLEFGEVYEILSQNQQNLNQGEIKIIQNIINNESKNERDKDWKEHWKLKWYSSLRQINPFKKEYQKLSEKLNLTYEYYENINKSIIRKGSISPFSVNDIIKKTNSEIVDFLLNFRPKSHFEEPNISGFAEALEIAVKQNPEKFANEIHLYQDVYFIYVYHILNGFKDAWESKVNFNWEKVLNFCKNYILDEKFYSEKLVLENDGWNATSDWVVGAIGNLLSKGMRNDENAFDFKYLPIAKEIIKILMLHLSPSTKIPDEISDYATYTLNSTAGKVLNALLDYSLRIGRRILNSDEDVAQIWEEDVKSWFLQLEKKGIIDGFIFEGWFFAQFYFLDKDWIIQKTQSNLNVEDKYWKAFFGGYLFENPRSGEEIYQLFIPHYEKAIELGFNTQRLIRHLVSFYLGRKEIVEQSILLNKFLQNTDDDSILTLIRKIRFQRKYYDSIERQGKAELERKILALWKVIIQKAGVENGNKQILLALSDFIIFIPKIDEEYSNLLLKSIKHYNKQNTSPFFLRSLVNLLKKGNPKKVAPLLGEILNGVNEYPYFSFVDENNMIELVRFLYENDEKSAANKLSNKVAEEGNDFLKLLYNEFNG